MSTFDDVFPMEERTTFAARWRRMARQWCPSGVVRGIGDEMWPVYWDRDWGGPGQGALVVGTGAVWVNGFYGEATTTKHVNVPSNVGLVVARLDPGTQNITLVWKEGPSHGPTPDPDGIWEVPLVYLWGDRWDDMRPKVPPEPELAPFEIPPWVPRGGSYALDFPATAIDRPGSNAIVDFAFLDWAPRVEAGRA